MGDYTRAWLGGPKIDVNPEGAQKGAKRTEDDLVILARAVKEIEGVAVPGGSFGRTAAAPKTAQAWGKCQQVIVKNLTALRVEVGKSAMGVAYAGQSFKHADTEAAGKYNNDANAASLAAQSWSSPMGYGGI
jgi:hypothetical protein